jgi:capsular exopolysaccharide synthesis family protein
MDSNSQALDRPRKTAEHIGLRAPASTLNADDSALDLEDLWGTISRNKWLILFICVLVTGGAAGITWVLPKVYEARSVVSVEVNPTTQATLAGYAPFPELSAEIGILENSGELAGRVVAEARAAADTSEGAPFTLFAPVDEGEPADGQTIRERLQDMMDFESDDEKGLIEITAQSENPVEASVLANVFAREYQQFSREMARSGVAAARDFLEGQLEKRKDDIQAIEGEWEQFARTNAVATDGETGQNVAQEYAELQTQRDALVFQLEQEERTLELLKEQLDTLQPNLRSKVLEEQRAQSLRTQIQALENQIADLKALSEQYYINDPSLRGNEDRVPELADMKRRIDGFEARKVDLTEELIAVTENNNLAGDEAGSIGMAGTQRTRIREQEMKVGQLEAQIRGLNNRIENYQSRIASIPRQTIQREQLNRRLTQAEQFHKEIAMELQRTIVAEESELGYVTIMRAAVTPMLPVSPDMQVNVILGLLLGLGLGIGVAFVRQSMDWQIYQPTDIQSRGYSLVGVIPKMDREIKKDFKGKDTMEVEGKQMSTRLFPLLNPWSPITENYRLVRANLQFAAAQNGTQELAQRIMVTSPEPGDGKTTTATNLAITIALSGRSVLLVDADMRRPQGHELLGVKCSPGLADVLVDGRADDIVQRTVVDGLFFLPAGVPSVPPTELLDSERMRTLLDQAGDRFDVVIVDTPPILAASDPIVIATRCDSVLVVATANKTDFRALEQVKSTLSAVGVSISGVIFNRYDVTKNGNGYNYGYDYKYDYSSNAELPA